MNKIESYIDKFAIVKDEVHLSKNDISQVHKHPYHIINQNEERTWICLESKIHVHKYGIGGSENEIKDKSFWMKVNECHIIEK